MNGIDNIAGYTLTVGTADFVITDSIAQYDPIVDNLADGDECSYKAQFIDASMSTDYETGVGTWNESAGTISRDTIKTSSNNGAIVNFGAGPKIVYIVNDNEAIQSMGTKVETSTAKVMTATERTNIAANTAVIATRGDSFTLDVGTTTGTVAAGDDGRFDNVTFDELDAADTLDGTEIVPVQQGVDTVITTVQDIAGNPMIACKGHATTSIRGYTNFSKTRVALMTSGAICELEPWFVTFSGVGAVAAQAKLLGPSPGFVFSTGTTAVGTVFAISLEAYVQFDVTKSMDCRFYAGVSALPSTEAFTAQIGFCDGMSGIATDGMFFQLSAANANWQAVVKNAAGETLVNTGIVGAIGVFHTFRVHYDSDPAVLATKFYIDEVLVATTTNATRVNDALQSLSGQLSITKSAGLTAATLSAYHFSFEIETAALAGFN